MVGLPVVGKKIVKSTDVPAWTKLPARGRWTVQLVPASASTSDDARRRKSDRGSQKRV